MNRFLVLLVFAFVSWFFVGCSASKYYSKNPDLGPYYEIGKEQGKADRLEVERQKAGAKGYQDGFGGTALRDFYFQGSIGNRFGNNVQGGFRLNNSAPYSYGSMDWRSQLRHPRSYWRGW